MPISYGNEEIGELKNEIDFVEKAYCHRSW